MSEPRFQLKGKKLHWLQFTGSKLKLYFPGLFVQITESRLVTMSVILCTQTVLHHLTIQVPNIRVCFNGFTIQFPDFSSTS